MSVLDSIYAEILSFSIIETLFYWGQTWALLSYLGYFLPYKYGCKKETIAISGCIPLMFHGLLVLVSCYHQLLTGMIQFGQAMSDFHKFLFEISCSFYIIDTGLMFALKRYKIEILIHHVLVVVGFCTSFWTGFGSHEIIACICCTEPSNIVMYGRYILKQIGWKASRLYLMIELLYCTVFIIGRLCFGSYVVYNCWAGEKCPLLVSLTGTGVLLESVIHVYQMPGILRESIKEHNKAIKKAV
ncbi:unnamed protein product [Moneuplotes crassus]|uniref:TLC domain-containing protein n=1 Tax=Euplotes crassus TaxID=5936 RepID=A0AAD1XWM4_EUPCR|nr:unnamed protein product [Moneuplotes crassus]